MNAVVIDVSTLDLLLNDSLLLERCRQERITHLQVQRGPVSLNIQGYRYGIDRPIRMEPEPQRGEWFEVTTTTFLPTDAPMAVLHHRFHVIKYYGTES